MSTPTTTPDLIKTSFLILSDTHASTPAQGDAASHVAFHHPLPKADVVLHCGDLTMAGHLDEYEKTLSMLEAIDADLKLVIAGNHDITLDAEYYARNGKYMHRLGEHDASLPRKAREMWTGERARRAGVTYLDEGLHTFALKNGAKLRVYASPYQPEFCNWAFPYARTEDRYNLPHQCAQGATCIAENPIPDFPLVDVMMTHGPPMGILDAVRTGEHVGCAHLLRAARRCKPRLHCFGHIHEGWGAQKILWKGGEELDIGYKEQVERIEGVEVCAAKMIENGAAYVDISRGGGTAVDLGRETLMVNASIMTVRYKPLNGPWVVDVDLEKAG